MTLLDTVGLTVAFLAPMPALPPERPSPAPAGGAWLASLIMASLVVLMMAPMIMIWSFHRPEETFRAQCEAQGGRAIFSGLDGSGPRRCDIAGRRYP